MDTPTTTNNALNANIGPLAPVPAAPTSLMNTNVPGTVPGTSVTNSSGPVQTPPAPSPAPSPAPDQLGLLLKNLNDNVDTTKTAYDTSKANVAGTENDLNTLSKMLGDQSSFTADQESAAGLPQLNADLGSLHSTQSFQTAAYLSAVNAAESGPGGTKGYMNNAVSNIDRQHGLDALTTSALIDAKNNDITTAQAKVDRAVSLQFDPIKNQIQTQLQILSTNKDLMTADQKDLADARSAQLQAQLKQIDDHQSNVKDAISTAMTQVTNGTLDGSAVSKAASDLMSGKTDLAGFYSAIGIDSTGTNTAGGNLAGYDISSYATDPQHTTKVTSIYNNLTGSDSQSMISNLKSNSPITGAMVDTAAQQYGVDPKAIIALMAEETQLGTDGSKGATQNNFGNVGNTDETMAAGGSVPLSTPQDGVNAVANWLANHKAQGPSYAQYGLLANTNFNPANQKDQNASQYLSYYLKNAAYPTASSLGISTRGGAGQTKFSDTAARASQLFFDATGQPLPDVNILKTNKGLIAGNNKLINNLDVQNNTVAANFALALKNIDTAGLNQNSQPVNAFLDNIKNLMGDPATAQYLSQNATLQSEVGSLIAVKNASGTTVYDKLSSAGLIPKNASEAQQKAVLNTLLQEANQGKAAIQQVNSDLYSQIDPLQTDPNNPNRDVTANSTSSGSIGTDLSTNYRAKYSY